MSRRKAVLGLCALILAAAPASFGQARPATSDRPPRKVIVGTVMQAFWVPYPGLQQRLRELAAYIDRLAEASQVRYGRGIDLAVLPEVAVTGEAQGDVVEHSFPFEGAVRETFARKAREHRCYIVVPMYLLQDKAKRLVSNVGILVGRNGEVVGSYRKLHPAVHAGSDSMEGGITPGKEAPVFDCDFGKLGIQICFDMEYDYGWNELARQGAELVAWPTQSPQTTHPAARALRDRCYIVSSNWRDNSTVFEPTGKVAAQVRSQGEVLAYEIDLSYAILPWSPQLRNGAALKEKYGDKAWFHYYSDEDAGLFWSNDSRVPIGGMMRALGLSDASDELRRIGDLYRKAGVPKY